MKKILVVLLCLVLVLGVFAGCGGDTKDGKVHIFYYNNADAYISSVRGALNKILDSNKVSYQNYDGENNQTKQSEQVEQAIINGASMIVVNIVNTGAEDVAQGYVDKAKAAGIPIVFFNREVAKNVIKSYDKAAFVGTNAPDAGHMQGEMIGDYLLANYDAYDLNGDGKISYAMFMGENGNNEAIYRTQFSVEDANKKLKAAGKPELMYYDAKITTNQYHVDPNGAWSATFGQEQMNTILAQYNEKNKNMIELVIANNDQMAIGTISALNGSGYNTGTGKTVPVFGVDAEASAVTAIDDGKMAGTVKQDADGMAKSIDLLIGNGMNGKAIMEGTSQLTVDADAPFIRVPYSVYKK